MKRIFPGVAISVIAFGIGLFASGTLTGIPAAREVDFAEYPVDLVTLISERDKYDGKIVRIKGVFGLTQDSTVGYIENGPGWIRAVCVADPLTCSDLFTDGDNSYVEVVGRYRSNAHDPHPDQRGDKVRLLEISKLKTIEPVGRGAAN